MPLVMISLVMIGIAGRASAALSPAHFLTALAPCCCSLSGLSGLRQADLSGNLFSGTEGYLPAGLLLDR